jgi:DNA processing protein
MFSERACWFTWSRIAGVGPVLLRNLAQHFGSLAAAWDAPVDELRAVAGVGEVTLQTVKTFRRQQPDPEELLEQHEQPNPHFWTPADADYPRLLLEIPDLPAVLYYRGIIERQENQGVTPMVGIVGTRRPTEYGKRWTRRMADTLTRQGFTVVSGMADGIDTQAHQASLAAGGRTLAVLGTGVDQVYPPRNRELYQEILQQGLVLSEYPAGTRPDKGHFPRRNRIVAGLCRAILIMEAPSKSGALITAYQANEYNRDVYVLPGSLDNPQAEGCLGLLSRGAQVMLSEGHLLELLGAMPKLDQSAEKSASAPAAKPALTIPADLAPELAEVLKALQALSRSADSEPVSVAFDILVAKLELPAGSVSSALLQLELLGLVSQQPGMRYQCER